MFQSSLGTNMSHRPSLGASTEWQCHMMMMQQQPPFVDTTNVAGSTSSLTSTSSLLTGLIQAARNPNFNFSQPPQPQRGSSNALNQDISPMATTRMSQPVYPVAALGNALTGSSPSQLLYFGQQPQQQHPSQILMVNPTSMTVSPAAMQQQYWPAPATSTYNSYLLAGTMTLTSTDRLGAIAGQGAMAMKGSEAATTMTEMTSALNPSQGELVFNPSASFDYQSQQVNQQLASQVRETSPTKSPKVRNTAGHNVSQHPPTKKRQIDFPSSKDEDNDSVDGIQRRKYSSEASSAASSANEGTHKIKISLTSWDEEAAGLRNRHYHKETHGSSSPGSNVSQKQSSYGRSGEHQLKIDFISFGEFPAGRTVQRFGRCRNVIPHKLSGRFEIYGEPWEFQILYASPNLCDSAQQEQSENDDSDSKVIPLIARLTHRESGQVTQKMETYQQAAVRQSAGPPVICSEVVQEAFSNRAKTIEDQMLKTAEQRSRGTFVEKRSLLKQQTAVRRLRERRGKDGHLLFGLTHEEVQTYWSKARNPDGFHCFH